VVPGLGQQALRTWVLDGDSQPALRRSSGAAAAGVVDGGHGGDGFGAGAGVALQGTEVLVSALGHQQGQVDAGLGKVGEGGVAKLVEGPASVRHFQGVVRPLASPAPTIDGTALISTSLLPGRSPKAHRDTVITRQRQRNSARRPAIPFISKKSLPVCMAQVIEKRLFERNYLAHLWLH